MEMIFILSQNCTNHFGSLWSLGDRLSGNLPSHTYHSGTPREAVVRLGGAGVTTPPSLDNSLGKTNNLHNYCISKFIYQKLSTTPEPILSLRYELCRWHQGHQGKENSEDNSALRPK